MQIQKEDIRQNILAKARSEFINKGFKDASMRSIATMAGIGLSNIYNYFRNKDEMFCIVLSGLLVSVEKLTREHNSPENIDLYVMDTEKYVQSQICIFFEIIKKHKEDFNLLLFKSAGSSLENFRDKYIDENTKTGIDYIKKTKGKYQFINTDISTFFIHTMSSWWMSIIAELVSHNLSDKEIEQFIKEYMAFGTAGWKEIMRIKG